MTCEEAIDSLTVQQWEHLARWLDLDLGELMALECRELWRMAMQKLDGMMRTRIIRLAKGARSLTEYGAISLPKDRLPARIVPSVA